METILFFYMKSVDIENKIEIEERRDKWNQITMTYRQRTKSEVLTSSFEMVSNKIRRFITFLIFSENEIKIPNLFQH